MFDPKHVRRSFHPTCAKQHCSNKLRAQIDFMPIGKASMPKIGSRLPSKAQDRQQVLSLSVYTRLRKWIACSPCLPTMENLYLR